VCLCDTESYAGQSNSSRHGHPCQIGRWVGVRLSAVHACLATGTRQLYCGMCHFRLPGTVQSLAPTTVSGSTRHLNSLASARIQRFSQKNSSFWLPYQHLSSSADCARELFNGSNGSASRVDCTQKKLFAWGVRVFCE